MIYGKMLRGQGNETAENILHHLDPADPYCRSGCRLCQQIRQKLRDLDFTVLDREDEPEELSAMIEEEKEHPFRMVYADQGQLYIAEGYGGQPTTGYSVAVRELYETENTVCIHTNLMGPEKGEDIREIATFPYVVVQLEYIDKEVIFD